MKVAIIVSVYLPSTIAGGVTTVAADHAAELASRDHDVTVLTSDILSLHPVEHLSKQDDEIGHIRVKRFPARVPYPHFSLIFSPATLLWLKEHSNEFDVFHIHYARELFSISAARLLLASGKRVFLQTHGMLDRREGVRGLIDKLVVARQLRRASGVFALQSHETSLLKEISPDANILHLPNGIPPVAFPAWDPVPKRSPKKVLFLSRLHPRKRVSDFIDAAKIILSRRNDVEFEIIGPDGGEQKLAGNKISSDEQLSAHVRLTGPVSRSEALQAMARSDVYVLPSVDEPFPMALIEALAIGVPCVATNRVHIVDLLRQFDVAEIVEPEPAALADGIEKLLDNNALANTRSKNGQTLVKNQLIIQKVVDQLENHYISNSGKH